MKSPYLGHVSGIVVCLTPAKCRQSLVGSRQQVAYGSLFPHFSISLHHTRSYGRSGGRVLLCVTYLCRRCLGYELRDREVVVHFPRGQVIFSTPREPTVPLGPTHPPLGAVYS